MMLDAFNWTYALIILVSAGPSNIVFAYALASIFPPKDARVYWGVQAATIAVAVMTKQYWSAEAAMVIGSAILIIPPLACLKGSMFVKVIVTTLAVVIQYAAELPVAVLWMVVVGQPIMDNAVVAAHFGEYILVVVLIHIIILALMYWLFVKACRRFVMRSSFTALRGEGRSGRAVQGRVFLAFPLAQLVLFVVILYLVYGLADHDVPEYMVPPLIMFVTYLGVDLLLFSQMQRYADKQLSDLRAASLEARADEYLAKAAHMQGQLRDAARLRHDLRNHVHVVEGLCERGDLAEAQAYLQEAALMLWPESHGTGGESRCAREPRSGGVM